MLPRFIGTASRNALRNMLGRLWDALIRRYATTHGRHLRAEFWRSPLAAIGRSSTISSPCRLRWPGTRRRSLRRSPCRHHVSWSRRMLCGCHWPCGDESASVLSLSHSARRRWHDRAPDPHFRCTLPRCGGARRVPVVAALGPVQRLDGAAVRILINDTPKQSMTIPGDRQKPALEPTLPPTVDQK